MQECRTLKRGCWSTECGLSCYDGCSIKDWRQQLSMGEEVGFFNTLNLTATAMIYTTYCAIWDLKVLDCCFGGSWGQEGHGGMGGESASNAARL